MAVTKWRSLDQRRILKTVLRFVDREGLEALSIRKLGAELRVEAMSFSSHVPNKNAARRDGGGAAGRLRIPPEAEGWEECIRGVIQQLAYEHPSSCPSS